MHNSKGIGKSSAVYLHAVPDADTVIQQNLGHVALEVEVHHLGDSETYEPYGCFGIVHSGENLNRLALVSLNCQSIRKIIEDESGRLSPEVLLC